MKLKETFITYDTGEEFLLVPTGATEFSGLVKGNQTFKMIVELLKKDRSKEEVTEYMSRQFETPRETIEKDVRWVISELNKIGALEDSL